MVWILAGLWLLLTFVALSMHERRLTNLEIGTLHLIRRANAEDAKLKKFLIVKPGQA